MYWGRGGGHFEPSLCCVLPIGKKCCLQKFVNIYLTIKCRTAAGDAEVEKPGSGDGSTASEQTVQKPQHEVNMPLVQFSTYISKRVTK